MNHNANTNMGRVLERDYQFQLQPPQCSFSSVSQLPPISERVSPEEQTDRLAVCDTLEPLRIWTPNLPKVDHPRKCARQAKKDPFVRAVKELSALKQSGSERKFSLPSRENVGCLRKAASRVKSAVRRACNEIKEDLSSKENVVSPAKAASRLKSNEPRRAGNEKEMDPPPSSENIVKDPFSRAVKAVSRLKSTTCKPAGKEKTVAPPSNKALNVKSAGPRRASYERTAAREDEVMRPSDVSDKPTSSLNHDDVVPSAILKRMQDSIKIPLPGDDDSASDSQDKTGVPATNTNIKQQLIWNYWYGEGRVAKVVEVVKNLNNNVGDLANEKNDEVDVLNWIGNSRNVTDKPDFRHYINFPVHCDYQKQWFDPTEEIDHLRRSRK